jgi:hypothetical protein
MESPTRAAAHLSPAAERFLVYVTGEPERTRRLDHLGGDYPGWLHDLYRGCPLQSWPTFVGAETLAEIRGATVGLTRLVKSIPERLLGGDRRRIAAHYGLPNEALVTLLLGSPNGLDGALVRNDFIDTPAGFKCLEVNAGSVGGWWFGYLEERFRSHPVIARFFAAEPVRPCYRDSLAEMLRHVIAHNLGKSTAAGGTLNVAIVIEQTQLGGEDARISRIYRELLAASGSGLSGSVVLCRYDALGVRENRIWYQQDGRPIQAILEMSKEKPPDGIFRSFKLGRVSLYNGPVNALLNDKRNLALLSEHADSPLLTAAERDLVRRYLPWTRTVSPGPVTYRGVTRPLPELLLAQREDFVLKPAVGFQGRGVALGRLTRPDTWAGLVREAVAKGGWLAQERLDSRAYLYQDGEQGYAEHDVVWGLFCFGDSYGGGFLRMMPRGTGDGVINSARGASEGILFEV